MNRAWFILLWLIGEAILIGFFLHAGPFNQPSHSAFYLVVSSIILTVHIWCLSNKNKQHVKKSSVRSIKWFFAFHYTVLSIAAMLYFELVNPADLPTMITIQLVLLSVLCLGMWHVIKPSKEINSEYKYLRMEYHQLRMIRNVIEVAKAKAERRADVPTIVKQSIVELHQDVRLITPGNEYSALRMEGMIMLEMNEILSCLREQTLDMYRLQFVIRNCSKLIADFRDTFTLHQIQIV